MMGPADYVRLSTLWWRLASESQTVIAYRLIDAAGLRGRPPSELARAMAEKPGAFVEATLAATGAAMAGHRPDQIATAAMTRLQAHTSGNAARLRRGRA
ncbi:antifreeze protein [Histidinibacterium lentulum]|uniref:Antifreeze protein n=1 Tax=Histidinibacterium lentulum TaxID=2480588 RepID=A0A3N2QUY1_9RHOB|nr:antifreeze protein [Histidinibacterium lentulum]ROT99033.1 antifreeze protein [Histidinibacterium lentulum]